MPRRLKYDIPGTDWRIAADALADPGPAGLYAPLAARPLVVDVGFGRGEFLLQLAEKERGSALLGIEISFKRVLKLARRLARTDLGNVRLVAGPAEQVLRNLPEGSVDELWVNFPDPWPKKRHHRRRLIRPSSIGPLTRCLASGGVLNVATDHVAYAEHIDAVLRAASHLENAYAPQAWLHAVDDRPATSYELEWRAQGRDFHFFRYRACGSGKRVAGLDSSAWEAPEI
jgi:tRNA (guanine-N7-)-methyltransferase